MLGMGSGQPNRVESLRIAFKKAGEEAKGAALASDAFFPFGIYIFLSETILLSEMTHQSTNVSRSELEICCCVNCSLERCGGRGVPDGNRSDSRTWRQY